MDKCINQIVKLTKSKRNTKDKMFVAKSYTKKEYKELRGYMNEFIEDVEKDFDTKKGKVDRIISKIWHEESIKKFKNK